MPDRPLAATASAHPGQAYRPEIDGLRALAVTLVILYHFGLKPLRGGFIGVDVFFVISGFLITSIIVADLDDGNFSFRRFYARRIRRIVPALAATIAVCLVAGWILFLPSDFRSLGWQAAFSAFGLSNFYFHSTADYFAKGADTKPLLHTWSLGIEEQFYLFWPALIFFAWRLRKSRKAVLTTLSIVAITSLIWSCVAVIYQPLSAFYLLPSRAWELALGGLLVFISGGFQKIPQIWKDAAGLLLVLLSAFILNENRSFPGASALPACIGAALLIAPSPQTSGIRQFLSKRPLRFLGQISYSLYLWHWPVLVFFKSYNNGQPPKALEAIVFIALLVGIAWLSFVFIETPFRRARKSSAITMAVAAGALCSVFGAAVALDAGVPDRFPPKIAYYDSFTPSIAFKNFTFNCVDRFEDGSSEADVKTCLSRIDGRPNVLLIGDSHAQHLGAGLAAAFPDVHFVAVATNGCKPMLTSLKKRPSTMCTRAFIKTLEKYVPQKLFDAVIVAARWRTGSYKDLPQTVEFLKQYTPQVVVIGPVMEYRGSVPDLLSAESVPRRHDTAQSISDYAPVKKVDQGVRKLLDGSGAEYYSALDAICPAPGQCKLLASDGSPTAFDYGHLTQGGSEDLMRALRAEGLSFAGQEQKQITQSR